MDTDILAPVDFMAVEFPPGQLTAEPFDELLALVRRGLIRILDLEFIAKAEDGTVMPVHLDDVEHVRNLDADLWDGASSGLLDAADIDALAAAIAPRSLAAIVVYENVWAGPLLDALDRSHATIVGAGRISVDDLLAALDPALPSPAR